MDRKKDFTHERHLKIFHERFTKLLKDTPKRAIERKAKKEKLNLSRQLILNYQNTDNPNPTLDKLCDISKYFDVSIDYLAGFTNTKNKNVSLTERQIYDTYGLGTEALATMKYFKNISSDEMYNPDINYNMLNMVLKRKEFWVYFIPKLTDYFLEKAKADDFATRNKSKDIFKNREYNSTKIIEEKFKISQLFDSLLEECYKEWFDSFYTNLPKPKPKPNFLFK